MKKNILYIGIVLFLFCSISACGLFNKKNKEWKPVKPQSRYYVHTVQWPQETLKLIAGWYTGNSNNWRLIADVNPVIDSDRLAIGTTVLIPDDLLKQKKPLPQYYLTVFNKTETKKTTLKPSKPPEKKDDIILFGPK